MGEVRRSLCRFVIPNLHIVFHNENRGVGERRRALDTPDLSQEMSGESQGLEVLVAMASPALNTRLPLDSLEQPFVLDLEQAVETFRGVQVEDFAAHFRVARRVIEEICRDNDRWRWNTCCRVSTCRSG